MHLCLSCNQPCNISAVFCESCRYSLLERSVEAQQEPQVEVSGGSESNNGLVDLAAPPHMDTTQCAPLRLTEGGRLLFWQEARSQTVKVLEEKAEASASVAVPPQATNVLTVVAPPVRHRMPPRVRRALLVFCIVGVLALSVDSVLLALSMMRHHVALQGVKAPTATVAGNPTPRTTLVPSSVTHSPFVLSTTRLLFTTTLGQGDPQPQTVALLSKTQQPFAWNFVPTSALPAWLHFSAMQGDTAGVASAQVIVRVATSQLASGSYTANLLANAFDTRGKALFNSPQKLTIVLTVLTPCSLNVTPEKLSFVTVLLSSPTPQTVSITESGDCAQPIHWLASSSAAWLTLSSTSGFASSSITVQASSSSDKLLGTSTAFITFIASDAHSRPLTGSSMTITVTLTVIA